MRKFRKISEFLEFVKMLDQREPISEEKLAKDLELSEAGDYTVASTVRGQGAIRARMPDLTTLFGMVDAEAGMAVVEGFGTAKIGFKESFSDTPTLIAVPFGFFELQVPWITVEWRQFTIAWFSVRLPIPQLTTMTIRLPSLCFMMNVSKDGFEVFNVIGRTTISYFAFGK